MEMMQEAVRDLVPVLMHPDLGGSGIDNRKSMSQLNTPVIWGPANAVDDNFSANLRPWL
jgi:hypothetical protein